MSLSRKRQYYGIEVNEDQQSKFKRKTFNYESIAKLFSLDKEHSHISIPRKPSGVLIGRSSSCDVRISGSDVSSKHCHLALTSSNEKELLFIVDMSSNGVFINDEKLGRGSSLLLKSGDKIGFAKTGGSFIFRYVFDFDNKENRNRKSFFDDYIVGKQLGTGHYAVVKEARDRTNGDIVAVKIFHPNRNNTSSDDIKLQQEINLLLSINHPNIVRFISHYVEPVNQNQVATYLVLEKVNSGELFQRIINKLKLNQDETKEIFKQLLSGLNYLHANDIIHRDIKPENILLDIIPRSSKDQEQLGPWDSDEYDVRVKIADFGLAKFIGELKFTNTLCGTPAYVAPEILANELQYSKKVDLWLAGVLLYVCLCGFPPFSEELAPPNMKEQILTGNYAFYSPYWDDISDSALELISNLLVVEPESRFDINQTCNHPWFQEEDIESEVDMVVSPKRVPVRSDSKPLTLKEAFTSELKFNSDTQS
ncbi:uncharacterized protein PRCAT00000368001 [Priceomyces carsonii]|uniref:uncharacterized protein n=1 Tax=Priceomyces carsonii TaxID=28549 RepID=UPI002EDA9A30|nr:unnamed protein product [Priceomyces carsonii]